MSGFPGQQPQDQGQTHPNRSGVPAAGKFCQFHSVSILVCFFDFFLIQKVSAKASVSKSFFLDQQLAWIGKTYDFYSWYRSDMRSLKEFLIGNNAAPLDPNTFSGEFLEIMKALPEPPPSFKKDISRYKNGKVPGKKKIEKALEELGLPCEIISSQKQINKERKTF